MHEPTEYHQTNLGVSDQRVHQAVQIQRGHGRQAGNVGTEDVGPEQHQKQDDRSRGQSKIDE